MNKIRFAAALAGIAAGATVLGLPAQASADTAIPAPTAIVAQYTPGTFEAVDMYCSGGLDGKVVWLQGAFHECKYVDGHGFVWVPTS
ncbi:hypothetical protein DFR70_103121 [Nocardia tenerifensis]|uniref:Uncharacterized protein n=1 Tax=Nocardia tenerifensis TaxID=228006 RepID=A0A318KGY4_9NOCA|nr:hypothetical protein [Nocardia tenerifensis]PXX66373.1 hypothetical protein DFR70_103121 [Nocardia tenerifensis]